MPYRKTDKPEELLPGKEKDKEKAIQGASANGSGKDKHG